jgi:hypothetical protein
VSQCNLLSVSAFFEFSDQLLQRCFGITEEHTRIFFNEQRIVHTGESGGHRTFEDNDCFGLRSFASGSFIGFYFFAVYFDACCWYSIPENNMICSTFITYFWDMALAESAVKTVGS